MKLAVLLLSCLVALPVVAQPSDAQRTSAMNECMIRGRMVFYSQYVHNAWGKQDEAMKMIRKELTTPLFASQSASQQEKAEAVAQATVKAVFKGFRGSDPFAISDEYTSLCRDNPEKFIGPKIMDGPR